MPTYEYACRACGEHVEVVQSFRDDPLTTCGLCGGALRKVFSAAGIVFKGSGYYVTDSRAAKAGGDKQPDKAAAGDGDSSGSSNESSSDTSTSGKANSGKSNSGKDSPNRSSSGKSSPGHKAAESA